MPVQKSDWLCIQCGTRLGGVFGGEIYPAVPGENLRTSGPNLTFTCPSCGQVKTWYTSDPVVRAVYQLVNAVASVAAKAMVDEVGKSVHQFTRE